MYVMIKSILLLIMQLILSCLLVILPPWICSDLVYDAFLCNEVP